MQSKSPPDPARKPSRRRFIGTAGVITGAAFANTLAVTAGERAGAMSGHAGVRAAPAGGRAAGSKAAQPSAAGSPGVRFRRLLEADSPPRCINCGDVATARLAEMHGFEIVMTGGSALSFSKYGIGDFGMITMDDLVEFCRRTADRVDTPIIADSDDGGGNPLNVYRTVQRMEKAGAACVMIEDLYGAKHLAGYDEGKILARDAMVDKVRAAVDARRDDDLVLLVRSDVVADNGPLEDALERVTAYAEAGGDVIFVPGIPLDQCRRAVEMAGRPILTGAPSLAAARDAGVGIYFIGAMGAIAAGAIDRAMGELARDGQLGESASLSLAGGRRLELIGNEAAANRAREYNALREEGQ